MPKTHHPRRGSHGFWPRKRAKKWIPRIRNWPLSDSDEPKVQAFSGYKVGMTHGFIVDYRKGSTTSGQEVAAPMTVIETPSMIACGLRAYRNTENGLHTLTEIWAENLDEDLRRTISLPGDTNGKKKRDITSANVDDVRLIAHTKPALVTGVPKKKPEIMELRIDGSTIEKRIEYCLERLGKKVAFKDFTREGAMVDILGVTKGKGFQGHVKRFGVKLLTHKNSKHRRMIGTLGPWHPNYVLSTVPQAGQTGFHQRTEYNKRVLKIGKNPDDINPKGGFKHYGLVRNEYILVHGSIPGPAKRLVRMRDPIRCKVKEVGTVEFKHISTQSKQGG